MKIIVAGLILGLVLVLSSIHLSESSLFWNLIVTVKPEKNPINDTEFPTITGTVTDEASKPIQNALVKITFAKEVITTTTDSYGNFQYKSALLIDPGYYMINVMVTKDGYDTGYASSTIMVNSPTPITYNKGISGDPIVAGNYTVYIGKVTAWNLETTCFVKFGDQYKRFLKTCDLYNLAPDDFKTEDQVTHTLTVIQYNDEYRLFPVSNYYHALALVNDTQISYIASSWSNYTTSN